MRKKTQMLTRLAKLAEIRSDVELKRFAAFRRHVDTLAAQQNEQRDRLGHIFAQDEAFSIEGARLASIEAGRLAREMARLEAELDRIRPGFDAARSRAMREFGRVRALEQLAEGLRDTMRKSSGRD